jgi:hypothetical protein
MLLISVATSLLSILPIALSAPAALPAALEDPYQCGYVLTERNSSSYAGLSAFKYCAPFYYNETISDYQDAFAYRLWGGCQCSFYV